MKPKLYLMPSKSLEHLAKRYVWWNPPDWTYQHVAIFLSNVMNLGCWNDIQILRQEVGDQLLKDVLLNAPPGYFNYRSWDYWHVKFNMLPIPPLPKRKL